MAQHKTVPVARKHGVDSMHLFGSYARGEATAKSDLDFIISRGKVNSLLKLGGLQAELADAFHKRVDILTDDNLDVSFRDAIQADTVMVYDGKQA